MLLRLVSPPSCRHVLIYVQRAVGSLGRDSMGGDLLSVGLKAGVGHALTAASSEQGRNGAQPNQEVNALLFMVIALRKKT